MATHELQIKAHLDTSSIQSELDRLNAQKSSAFDSSSDSANTTNILRQLNQSLVSLNRTMQKLTDSINRPVQSTSVPSGRNNVESNLASGIGGSKSGDLARLEMLKHSNAQLQNIADNDKNDVIKRAWANAQIRTNRQGISSIQEQLLFGNRLKFGAAASFGSNQMRQLGELYGGGFGNLVGSIGSISQSAGMGYAIGGTPFAVLGGITQTGLEVANMFKELAANLEAVNRKYQEQTQSVIDDSQIGRWENMTAEQRQSEYERLMREEKSARGQYSANVSQAGNAASNYTAGFWNTIGRKVGWADDPMDDAKKFSDAADACKTSAEHYRRLADQLKKLIDKDNEKVEREEELSNEGHEAFVASMLDSYEKQDEMYKRQEELIKQRESIMLDLEEDFQVQGSDILGSMGKMGRYMSNMQISSLKDDKYSPITKKLETITTKLDKLREIDKNIKEAITLG